MSKVKKFIVKWIKNDKTCTGNTIVGTKEECQDLIDEWNRFLNPGSLWLEEVTND